MSEEQPEFLEPSWHWRNCRSLSLSFWLNVWPWTWGRIYREDDVYGGHVAGGLGPIGFRIEYNIGNSSSYSWIVSRTSLCDEEAWERALAYEGRLNP